MWEKGLHVPQVDIFTFNDISCFCPFPVWPHYNTTLKPVGAAGYRAE